MAFRGGIADKLGNEYERKWAVRKLLDVFAGKVNAIRYEGISNEFHGVEFALHRPDFVEWHQTKINASKGNWTPTALDREGLIEAFKRRLSSDATANCVFVSQDPARQLRELCKKARIANDLQEFREAISKKDGEALDDLVHKWDTDERNAFRWLRRCEFRTESEQSIEEAIEWYGRHLFKRNTDVFASLSNYLVSNLNARITAEVAREWVRAGNLFTFRPGSLDRTLREDVDAANLRYLHSYTTAGLANQQIPRAEAKDILGKLQSPDGPFLILLTGEAGSGKSSVVRQVTTGLKNSSIPHLAFRIDRHLSCHSIEELSTAVLNRDESHVSALENLSNGKTSVLIIDQIDAVSEVSGRTGAIKDVMFELVRESQDYGDVRCLLVCRSFDLENDPQYRELEEEHQAERVSVKRFTWVDDVAPILTRNGFSDERFTKSERDLLCLPLNLAVFLEIGDPNFDFSTGTALMEGLLKKKTRDLHRNRDVGWNIQAPLCAMAEWMSEKQELICPDSVLDNFDGAQDWLSSDGLIVTEQRHVAFFHESFFDFIFARNFTRSNREIVEFLTSDEQHLFRRTQVRQILTAMRKMDKPTYLKALEDVLTHSKIRFHIKHAVAQWLGTVHEATSEELAIIQSLDDGAEEFPILMRRALFTGDAWFDQLNDRGEIKVLLESDSRTRIRSLLVWLSTIAEKCPATVAVLMRNWWKGDLSRNEQLIEWFGFLQLIRLHRSLIALLSEVVNSPLSGHTVDQNCSRIVRIVQNLCKTEPEASVEILDALFAAWFKVYPQMYLFTDDGSDDINTLELPNLAEKAPGVFLDVMIPILKKSVQIALERGSYSNGIPVLYKASDTKGPDTLISLCRNALRRIAAASPKDAEARLNQIDPRLHEVVLHLHLETIQANPTALGNRLEALLNHDNVFKAGFSGVEWKSFADAARSVVKAESVKVQNIEDRVFRHRPEQDLAVEIANQIRTGKPDNTRPTRRDAIEALARSGHVEWCVLKTIGCDLLSSRGKKRLSELERKFPTEPLPKPRNFEGGFVESPIPTAVVHKMTDDNLLSAIGNDRYRNNGPQLRKGEIVGGATELGRELESLAKSEPRRFAHFFLRVPDDSNSIFGQHLLQGLAVADHTDEEATIKTLRAAHSHPNRPFGLQIVRLVERHPWSGNNDDVFEALLWYAEHGEVEDVSTSFGTEPIGSFPSIERLVPSNSKLDVEGMNSTRGVAWRTLGKLVTHHPHRAADIWGLVELRASEETSAQVRAMMLHTLTSLYRLDRRRFGACLQSLTETAAVKRDDDSALSPLATRTGIRLFPFVERDLPVVALELMERMVESSDRRLHLIGTWWALCERLRRGNTADRFTGIEHKSPAHTKLWASILSEFAVDTEFREMAISELQKLFSHKVPDVRKAAVGVFLWIPKDEFPHFTDMARTVIRSAAFEDAVYQIIKLLEETPHDVTELVLEVCEVILGDGKHHRSVYHIQKLLKREYVNSENRPGLRKGFLDLIDEMAERNITGTDDLIQLDDRQ